MAIGTREEMVSEWLRVLKGGGVPWQSPLVIGPPVNGATGRSFTKANRAWLSYRADRNGWTDPRWYSGDYARRQGWKVREGEEANRSGVDYFYLVNAINGKPLTEERALELEKTLGPDLCRAFVQPAVRTFGFYNAEQLEGVPERSGPSPEKWDTGKVTAFRDALIGRMDLAYAESETKMCYVSSTLHNDKGLLSLPPPPDRFPSAEVYLKTLLHEAAHAAGDWQRTNLPTTDGKGGDALAREAREELRAEIASAFVMQDMGLATDYMVQNSAAYIRDWAAHLEKAPDELFRAIDGADAISRYLEERIGIERTPEEWQCER